MNTERTSTTILSVALAVLLAFGGCDRQPTQLEGPAQPSPEAEPKVAQSSSDEVVATAVLRAQKTRAAQNHGFRPNEKVGWIEVTDDGETIVVTDGLAQGLDPDNSFSPPPDGTGYISLFYGKQSSVSGSPSSEEAAPNAPACGPGAEGHPLRLTRFQMRAAFWKFNDSGDAFPVDIGPELGAEYVPVDEIGTVSIRDLRVEGGFQVESVVACGVVTRDLLN